MTAPARCSSRVRESPLRGRSAQLDRIESRARGPVRRLVVAGGHSPHLRAGARGRAGGRLVPLTCCRPRCVLRRSRTHNGGGAGSAQRELRRRDQVDDRGRDALNRDSPRLVAREHAGQRVTRPDTAVPAIGAPAARVLALQRTLGNRAGTAAILQRDSKRIKPPAPPQQLPRRIPWRSGKAGLVHQWDPVKWSHAMARAYRRRNPVPPRSSEPGSSSRSARTRLA